MFRPTELHSYYVISSSCPTDALAFEGNIQKILLLRKGFCSWLELEMLWVVIIGEVAELTHFDVESLNFYCS